MEGERTERLTSNMSVLAATDGYPLSSQSVYLLVCTKIFTIDKSLEILFSFEIFGIKEFKRFRLREGTMNYMNFGLRQFTYTLLSIFEMEPGPSIYLGTSR